MGDKDEQPLQLRLILINGEWGMVGTGHFTTFAIGSTMLCMIASSHQFIVGCYYQSLPSVTQRIIVNYQIVNDLLHLFSLLNSCSIYQLISDYLVHCST